MDTNITIPKKEIAPGVFSTGGVATMPTVNPIQPNVITPQALQSVAPLNVQTPPELQSTTPNIAGDMAFLQNLQNQQTAEQQALTQQKESADTGITNLLKEISGQGQEQLSLEQQFVNPINTQLTDLSGQIGSQIAEYQQAEKLYEKAKSDIEAGAGRKGITTSAVMGQQGAIDRAKASELNVKASNIGILQAQALALQGKVDLAQRQVDRAIDLKYKGKEQELAIRKFQLDSIKENLSAEEKKKAEALNFALNKEEKRVAEQKENDKAIQNVAMQLASFGVDPSIIKDAKTVGEAIQMAGKNLQDPLQKLQIQKLKNDIAKQAEEARILKQYGGLSPEQWAKKQEEALKGLDATKRTAKDLENQKTQVGTILNSTAINSVVGPTAISRSRGGKLTRTLVGAGAGALAGLPFGGLGAIPGAIVGGIAGATLPGISDEVSGRADDLVALTEQMLSQQFLDKLITVKGQGATFGALTDREGNSLRSAANAIAQTAITDKNDKVIGYDMSENEFRRQLGIMNDAIQLAEIENTGKVISNSEDADLDNLWQSGGALVAPGNFYQ